ncbi:hypothetical protein BJ875DRAFT_476409 [Amylocarpus encephaloides]|uniref:Uncharacterized protein n=1 Tax=Amylocarpus encephaloides TaxID=45428 RepID=A0A9P7Y888_9HELO|nr:hypothetical protein BJ875DRAFT_476409 [Amylocarpus encephaloides]
MAAPSPQETRQMVTILNREAHETLRNRPPHPYTTPSNTKRFKRSPLSQKETQISLLAVQILVAIVIQVLLFFTVIFSSGNIFSPGDFWNAEAAEYVILSLTSFHAFIRLIDRK